MINYFQLRYLQTLNSISAEHNSTIVFPVPIDLLSNFMQQQHHSQLPIPDSLSLNAVPGSNSNTFKSIPRKQSIDQGN